MAELSDAHGLRGITKRVLDNDLVLSLTENEPDGAFVCRVFQQVVDCDR